MWEKGRARIRASSLVAASPGVICDSWGDVTNALHLTCVETHRSALKRVFQVVARLADG